MTKIHWSDVFYDCDIDDRAPACGPGWYATQHSWDGHEGIFPGAHWWDGKHWLTERSVWDAWAGKDVWSKGADGRPYNNEPCIWWFPWRFASEDEASDFAYLNDPEA